MTTDPRTESLIVPLILGDIIRRVHSHPFHFLFEEEQKTKKFLYDSVFPSFCNIAIKGFFFYIDIKRIFFMCTTAQTPIWTFFKPVSDFQKGEQIAQIHICNICKVITFPVMLN